MKRKITFLMAAFLLLCGLGWAQTREAETFTFSELGYANAENVTTVEGELVTLTFDKGTNNNPPKYYTLGTAVRMYTNNTLKVALNTSTRSSTITAIGFTFSENYTGSLQNWSGSSDSVSFTNTASGQARIQVITVTVSDGSTPITYTVTYDCNGGTSGCPENVTGLEAGAEIMLADGPVKENYTFAGWSDGNELYDEGDAYTVSGNVTFAAQWTSNTPAGNEQWVLTSLADLSTDDVFVIVGNNGSDYAMTNNNGTGSAPAVSAVTVENDMITSTVSDNIQWNISGNATDGYTFYPNGSSTTWLYCTNTNNGVRVGTNDDKTFKLDATSGYLKHDGTSRYIGIYNSQDWRCYTSPTTNINNQTFAFYKKVTGDVLPPSITANNVEIEYNATAGTIQYTINNAVDGSSLTASTDSEWLTLGTVGETVPFTCTANEAATERIATVTLTYTYNRETVTKNVTVTQAGNPDATMTIAEVRAQGTGDVVTKGVVTSCVGTTGYIQDATAAICVYGVELTVGNEIRVSGTLSTYHGLLEITNPVATMLSEGNIITPEVMTIADINTSTNQGWLVKIENATVTAIDGQNTTIAQGENTIVVRGISSNIEYSVNDVISMTGNIGCYDGTQIVNPTDVEVIPSTTPVINAEGIELAYDATSGEIAYTIDNPVTGTSLTATTDAEWISNIVVGASSITFDVTENDGNADRSATIILSYEGAENVEVTVIQNHYVAPAGNGDYVRISSLDQLTDGSIVIVAARHNSTANSYYAMKNTTSGKPEGTLFTSMTSGNDEILTSTITDAQDEYYWTVNVSDTSFTFTNANEQLMGYNSGTNFTTGGDNISWTIERSTAGQNAMVAGYEGFVIKNANTPARAFAFNGTAFGAYATTNMTAGGYNFFLDLFVQITEPATQSFTLDVAGYTTLDNPDGGYVLIASPIDNMNPAEVENMLSNTYDLYYYDENPADGLEWRNYKANAFNLVSGKGYLYANSDNVTLTFTGTPYNGNGEVTLYKQSTGELAGWNLVGNPFANVATLDREFYVMNPEGTDFITADNNSVNAMQGIFVIAQEDGETITFVNTEDNTEPTPSEGKIILNVNRNRGNVIDRAIVSFDENHILPKFMLNENNTKLFFNQNGEEYAVVSSELIAEMPVSFSAAENGTYTLNVNVKDTEMDYLHLIDNKTGEDIDLKANPSYSFEANTSDVENRFTLVFNSNTGVNENNDNFAFFNGSEWVINNTDNATVEVIDMLGRSVITRNNATNSISTKGLASGVYTIRLTKGNDVKTQKIVVE